MHTVLSYEASDLVIGLQSAEPEYSDDYTFECLDIFLHKYICSIRKRVIKSNYRPFFFSSRMTSLFAISDDRIVLKKHDYVCTVHYDHRHRQLQNRDHLRWLIAAGNCSINCAGLYTNESNKTLRFLVYRKPIIIYSSFILLFVYCILFQMIWIWQTIFLLSTHKRQIFCLFNNFLVPRTICEFVLLKRSRSSCVYLHVNMLWICINYYYLTFELDLKLKNTFYSSC